MKLTNGSVARPRLNPGPFGDVDFTRHHSSRQSYVIRALGPSSITPTPSPPQNRLLTPPAGGPLATDTKAKAAILASRLFPQVNTSTHVTQQTAPLQKPTIPLSQGVDVADVSAALDDAKPWKAAGPDGLPIGFPRACGRPAADCLATLFSACLRLGY